MSIKYLAGAACLLACAPFTAFGQTSVDRSFNVTAENCDGVQWSARALATYPTIASACQAVEERNGKHYVKFEGVVKRNADEGRQLTVDFKDGGDITLSPPADTHLYINGRRTPVSDLSPGDEVNFYIAEDRLAAQFPQDETPTPEFVAVPIVAQQEAAEESEQLAEALPATAGPLPWLALCGVMTLGLGAALTVRRKRR